MACTTIEEIIKGCENNLGGVYRMWVNDQEGVTGTTVDDDAWEVTAMLHTAFKKIEFNRYVGNVVHQVDNSNENGSSVETSTITLPLLRREGAKSRALKIMGEGNRYLAIVYEDGNGKFWYIPNAQLTTSAGGSGTAKVDGSKYEVTFVAMNDVPAYEVDSSLIATLESVVS